VIIYYFMKWYLGWMAKLYYRRVYFKGYELIPDGKPAIFAANHPAAFMEPIILGSTVRSPLSFLVLASYIANSWLQWFFRSLKMVPIYRADISGRETLKKNEGTFQYVYDSLKNNAHILIFPEASTSFVYQLRPLKKGIARMSVGFMDKNPEKEMYIVPVGVNFIHPSRFRSDVFVDVGTPIDLCKLPAAEEAVMINQIVKATSDGMSKVVYDIADEQKQHTTAFCIQMFDNNFGGKRSVFGQILRHNATFVQRIKNLTVLIDRMSDEQFQLLDNKINEYRSQLRAAHLTDAVLVPSEIPFIVLAFIVLAGLPFFVIALLLNSLHLLFSWYLRKYKIERQEFQAPVTMASAAIFILICSLIFIILGIFLEPMLLGLVLALPLSLVIGVFYYDHLEYVIRKIRWFLLKSTKKDHVKALRKEIISIIVE